MLATLCIACTIGAAVGLGKEANPGQSPHVAVVGAGYSGLSAALELKLLGYDVSIYEMSGHVGGRAYNWTAQGFTFDAGPSWYWMPHIFENIFKKHGRSSKDFYNLTRLDPAYAMYFAEHDRVDIPGDLAGLEKWIFSIEPESRECLDRFMADAKVFYEKGIDDWIWKPMVSIWEMLDFSLATSALQYNMFGSLEGEIYKCVKNERVRTILKWPVIFLGAAPKDAASMYSLMTYAGHADGTWYPTGGMAAPAEALAQTARDAGVRIHLNSEITRFDIANDQVQAVCIKDRCDDVAGVVASGDYYHMEQVLLPKQHRRYSPEFWSNQAMSPSVLLYYIGTSKNLNLKHHTFFFEDNRLDDNLKAAVEDHHYKEDPVFYVTSTSQVDPKTAPAGGNALFILVPVSYKLNGTDTQAVRDKVFDSIMLRMEKEVGPFRDDIVFKKDFGSSDFAKEFYSFRGNAFGHANLLSQSLVLKPSMDSLLGNMVFAGHLTNPGPGIPPALASGGTAAKLLHGKLHPSWLTARNFLIAVCLFALAWRFSVRTELQLAQRECMRLFYNHGRSFFAGASLMSVQQFLDTSALYGLLRIADDCVDDVDDHAERKRRIDEFEGIFWRCMDRGSATAADHPIMPAVIDTSLRLGLEPNAFVRFFKSMRDDSTVNICRNMDETMNYIEGSAAVVGVLMLPILMVGYSQEEQDAALPCAKDLGRAFQLTNFCRDIDEDVDLQRQYIPVDLCEKHGVDLALKSSKQPGFGDVIEEMFARCDELYRSGDIGVTLLPENVRPVITVASRLYQSIQQEVRDRDYHVFDERCRVPMKKKLRMTLEHVGLKVTLKMVFAEIFLLTLFAIDNMATPFCLLVGTWQFCEHFSWPGLSYAGFHFIFALPALVVLVWLAIKAAPSTQYLKLAFKWTGVLCVLAVVWSTPWDNYLVKSGIWKYSETKVLFTIGYVPIEEYAFFIIETVMVAAIWVWQGRVDIIPHHKREGPGRILGLSAFAVLAVASLYAMTTERGMYLGLITIWATPVLALQWFWGADALMAQREAWQRPLMYSWIYLCLVDRCAIRNGCWAIQYSTTLPQFDWLPVEEAWFFLLTATMCTWGLQLFMNVSTLDCEPAVAFQRVRHWSRKGPVAKPSPPNLRLRFGFLAVAVGVAACLRTSSEFVQLALVAVPSLLFGLPLGKGGMAMLSFSQMQRKTPWFMFAGCIAAALTGWWLVPTAMLVVAILFACFNFGHSATQDIKGLPLVDIIARGGFLMLAARQHPEQTKLIISQLASTGAAPPFFDVLHCCSSVHLACLVISMLYHSLRCHKAQHLLFFIEMIVLALMACILPPLIFFTVYFNLMYVPTFLMHAVSLKVVRDQFEKSFGKYSLRAMIVPLVSVAAVALLLLLKISTHWFFKAQGGEELFTTLVLRTTFVLLSVSSVPSMCAMLMLRVQKPGAFDVSMKAAKDNLGARLRS